MAIQAEQLLMFQHTAARRRLPPLIHCVEISCTVSTHSRAEAAAQKAGSGSFVVNVSTHSRAEAAALKDLSGYGISVFQHTAARRRLPRKRVVDHLL